MTDDPSPSNSITSISGGVNLDAQRDVNIGGDVVGRDKIIQNIQNIDQRARTAAEEAEQARAFEAQHLAQGVSAFVQRLQERAGESTDAGGGGPYKGLLEYRLSDAEIFFGRDRAIRELLEHLQRSSLTVLHAESGAGKTSLLQAGVSPHLIADEYLPLYLRPYNVTPSLALKRAFLPNLTDTPHLAQAPLRDFLSRVCDVLGAATTLYIFLDQFEEFFTQLEETTRPEFVRELAECLEDESLNVRWVLALRSEYFGNLASFRPRIRNPFENDYRLNRLTREEAHEAVVKPSARRGISFEDGLIDTILSDLGEDEVEPPQVQLVCSTLYETLPPKTNVITREMYVAQGGAAGILREHLGRVLKRDLPAEQRAIAQHLLEELITSDIHRVMRTHAELVSTLRAQNVKAETLDAVLSQLVDSRLLRVEEVDDEPAYELAHDYLLGEIKLDPAVQARKAAQELLDQEVHAYQRYSTLLSDDKLAIIEARRSELVLNNDAKALIQKSERALKRRQRFILSGIGLVIVLFIVGALSILSAVGAQNVANQARVQQATSEAGAVAANQSATMSAASAAQANESAAAATTREALAATRESQANTSAATATAREAIANATIKRAFEKTGIVPVGDRPSGLIYDGARLWVANSGESTVQAIDPTTGNAGPPIRVGGDPYALAYDDSRLWVANSMSDTVQAIDPLMNQAGPPILVGSYPRALVYDHTRLWVANTFSDTIQSIDPVTGKVGVPVQVGGQPLALAYDGTRLWVANSMSDTVQAIDPATGKASSPIQVGDDPRALVYDGKRLWVANYNERTVQAIDPETNRVDVPIQVDDLPTDLLYDGTRLWVNFGRVQAIDPATKAVGAPISVGSGGADALTFDGARLWVALPGDDVVKTIDPSMGDKGAPIQVGGLPYALAFNGSRLWLSNEGDNQLKAIDPMTLKMSALITVSGTPSALAYDGKHLWMANWTDTVQALDPETGSVVGTSLKFGFIVEALAWDGVRLWGANLENGTIQAIDSTTGSVSTPLKLSESITALAYAGKQLWVAAWPQTLFVIDPATGETVKHLRGGGTAIALSYDGAYLWAAYPPSDDGVHVGEVGAIDPVTRNAFPHIKVGGFPVALAYDGARLWFANHDERTVQYIVVHQNSSEHATK